MGQSRWIGRGDESADQWVRDLQRIENIGSLAYGVVHDCNDLLTVILGTADLIRADAIGLGITGAPILEDVDEITAAADRAGQLTREFLRLSASLAPALQPVDLGRVATDVAQLLSAALPARIELAVASDREATPIRGDPTLLRSLALNLVLAARIAIGNRAGVISIDVAVDALDETGIERFRDGSRIVPGRHVVVRVASDGAGSDQVSNELAMAGSIARRHGAGLHLSRSGPALYEAAFPLTESG